MATGEVIRAQRLDPRPVVILDRHGLPRHHALFENNPRIAYRRGYPGHQEIINGSSVRPYIAGKTDRKWDWKAYKPEPGEIYFDEAENLLSQQYQGFVIVEPNVKARDARNKDWGWENWRDLRRLLKDQQLAQVGPPGTQLLPGVTHLQTNTFREACAILSHAKGFVGTEGGLHHVAAAIGVPSVVIFGGFISPGVTGYATQTNLFTGDGLGCGARIPCTHCRDAMAAITPEKVEHELRKII